jgi:hypothetical protein
MLDSVATGAISSLDLAQVVLAVGGLGTAAYGLVDASKGLGGGISNRGFGDIKEVISKLIPARPADKSEASAVTLPSALTTLRANWLNGMAFADQKSVAKALIKLNLTEASANGMAAATGVDAKILTSVATKLVTGDTLTPQETDVYGRFDLLLSALLDQGYQRADQRYRNSAKIAAVPIAVILALVGAHAVYGSNANLWLAFLAGLAATPLAPVAKDVASAIQAGTKLAQSVKK